MLKTKFHLQVKKAFSILVLFILCACGVKGDPIPPEAPPTLGRGQPSYRRAAEEIALPKLPLVDLEEEDDEDDEDDEDGDLEY